MGCYMSDWIWAKDKVDVVIAPTALHMGHVKAPLEGLGMQVRY